MGPFTLSTESRADAPCLLGFPLRASSSRSAEPDLRGPLYLQLRALGYSLNFFCLSDHHHGKSRLDQLVGGVFTLSSLLSALLIALLNVLNNLVGQSPKTEEP